MYQFSGHGQVPTQVITYTGALVLIQLLPGANARNIRMKFANVCKRFLAGDASMLDEIQANQVSDSPLHALAREEMAYGADDGKKLTLGKRSLELTKLELQEQRVMLRELSQQVVGIPAIMESRMSTIENKLLMLMQAVEKTTSYLADEYTQKMELRDAITSVKEKSKEIEKLNKKLNEKKLNRGAPLRISEVAREMHPNVTWGKMDLITIGKMVAKQYLLVHGEHPPYGEIQYNENIREGNQYYESDRELIKMCVTIYCLEQAQLGIETVNNEF